MTHPLVSALSLERPALILEDGRTIPYGALHEDLERAAARLEPRSLLFIVANNAYPSVLFYLAALSSGAVPLMLNADTHPDHVARLIDIFSPAAVLTAPDHPAGLAAAQRGMKPDFDWDGHVLYAATSSARPALHADLACLATTSGSTGSAKLVRLSRDNLVANARSIAEYLNITPDDRAVASLPISYSYGLSVINSHLFAGASLLLTDRSLMEKPFWAQMAEHAVTSFAGVPYHYEMLMRLRWERMELPALRKMTQAGGRLAPEKIRAVHDAAAAKGVKFWTMYGQTEASPRISYLPTDDTVRKLGSIGKAIPGGRLWVRGEGGDDITASGEVGELVYEGPNVCLGYAETADDLALGDVNRGVLRTGDLARGDDEGYFFLEGRLKRFLKIYGNRISLDRVERFVTEKGLECAVDGRDDHLTVHVVDAPDLDGVALRRDVAAFAGVNAAAVAVKSIGGIPRLPTGKVDYQCLAQTSPSA